MTQDTVGKIEILGLREAYAGWTKLLVASTRLPDGRTVAREIEDHGAAVCVLPYHPVRKTAVLVRQARVPVLYAAKHHETLEAVAGGIEHEKAEACAHREVMEEALLKLDSLEHVFTAWTMPGISTELMYFYLAVYSGDTRPGLRGGADDDEDTVPIELELAALARMADDKTLSDAKTLLLVQTLRLRRPDLF